MNKTSYWKLYVFVLFVIVGGLIYWNCLSNPFFYDDEMYVVKNLNIRTLDNIFLFFKKASTLTAKGYPGGHYRPLVVTSYAINYAIGGLNTFSYHLFNLLFHIGSAFLVFLIVNAMLGNSKQLAVSSKQMADKTAHSLQLTANNMAAVAAGLIFLVHPFNSEAVNYITARSSLMSGFFYLLAFWCFVKFRQHSAELTPTLTLPRQGGGNNGGVTYFYIVSLLAFVAGMLSKEVVITLPIVLWLYDLYGFSAVSSKQFSFNSMEIEGRNKQDFSAYRLPLTAYHLLNWRSYIAYVPFVLVVVIPYLLLRIFSFGSIVPHFQRDIFTQMFTQIPVLVKHWQMFLFPYPLTPLHDVMIQNSFFSFYVISSALITAAWVTVAVVLLFSFSLGITKLISFFMFWFLVVLLPTTIFPLNFIFQENRGYLAIVSFVVISGLFIGWLTRIGFKKAGAALLALLVIIYSIVVFQRNSVWKDELTLWNDAVKKAPGFSVAYTALGVAYRRAGMYNRSIEASKKAIEIGGWNNFVVHDNLARIYIEQKRWDLSAIEFEKAVKAEPSISVSHNLLGVAYYKLGKYELAEAQYREAIRLDPSDYAPYFNIGVLYGSKGMSEEAVRAYHKLLSIYPGHTKSRLHIGIELEKLGRKKEAADYFRSVIQSANNENERILADEARRRLIIIGEKGAGVNE